MLRALEYVSAAVLAGFFAMLLFSGSVAEQVVPIKAFDVIAQELK